MAIDTEPKRWGMLRLASGVSPSIVFNPTGSDADTVIERVTVLGLYGAVVGEPVAVVAGAGSAQRRRRRTIRYYAPDDEYSLDDEDYDI